MFGELLKKDVDRIVCLSIIIFLLPLHLIKAQEDLSYKLKYKQVDSTELHITVYPSLQKQERAPAIIFFFGGGWKHGSIKQFKPHAQYFSQRGLINILVNYRVASRHHTTPFDALEDTKDALNFIGRSTEKLGIDKNNIVLSGGSAGGQLALMSTFSSKGIHTFRPKAMVLFNPVVDTGPDGYGYKRLGDAYRELSPVDNIPSDPPPCLLFFGTEDRVISTARAKDFCHLLIVGGGSCDLKLYKGQEHGFFNFNRRGYFVETLKETDLFLIRKGIIEGEPNVEEWLRGHG